MALWTQNQEKANYVNSYFASMSSMATRIIERKESIKLSYGEERWNNISCSEQEKMYDKYIITPDASSRYKSVTSEMTPLDNVERVFPTLIMHSGQTNVKRMDDTKNEEICFKDEHSDPFCWETKSQMNMDMPPPVTRKVTTPVKIKRKSNEEKTNTKVVNATISTNGVSTLSDVTNSSNNNKHEEVKKPAPTKLKYVSTSTNQSRTNRNNNQTHQSTTEPARLYTLPTKDHTQTSSYQKNKSSRINPRASLTLDGAIRNLEVALQEQNKYVEMNKMKVVRQSSNTRTSSNPDTYKMTDDVSSCEQKSSSASEESSPLLKRSEIAVVDAASVRKSGYDFLDNW
ncbi:uncharacterized protein LOC100178179 isoform X2 [Ciona intestinalis]